MRGFSKLMRHVRHPEMDDSGWLPLQSICEWLRVSEDQVVQAVVNDKKGRMEYDSLRERVRARYGHSIELVRPPWLRYHVEWDNVLGVDIMHATSWEAWDMIKKDGVLRPMNRMTVHFATDKRFVRNRPCVLALDVEKCKEDGVTMYWATQHVVVCPYPVPIHLLKAHEINLTYCNDNI